MDAAAKTSAMARRLTASLNSLLFLIGHVSKSQRRERMAACAAIFATRLSLNRKQRQGHPVRVQFLIQLFWEFFKQKTPLAGRGGSVVRRRTSATVTTLQRRSRLLTKPALKADALLLTGCAQAIAQAHKRIYVWRPLPRLAREAPQCGDENSTRTL